MASTQGTWTGDLDDRADLLAVAQDVTDRAIVAVGGVLDRLAVVARQHVLLLDDDATRLGQLVDSIEFHRTLPATTLPFPYREGNRNLPERPHPPPRFPYEGEHHDPDPARPACRQ